MNKKSIIKVLLSGVILSLPMIMTGQGKVEDYNRAYSLREKFNVKNVINADVRPQWIGSTDKFCYVDGTDGADYIVVDAKNKKKSQLFDSERLAKLLSKSLGKEVDAHTLRLDRLQVNKGLDSITFVRDNHHWSYAIKKNSLTDKGALPIPGPQRHWMEVDDEKGFGPVASPDGTKVAFIKNDNVYVRDVRTGDERQLSHDGTLSNYYSSYISWSPDGTKVVSCKIRPVEKRYVYYVESSPKDQSQPRLHKQEYAKPGDELRFKVPCIFDVNTGREVIPSTELFAHQYEVYAPQWDADSKAVTFEYNERGHKVYRVLELNAESGDVRAIIEETSDTYVNYPRHFRHDLNDGNRIIWMSERDNWNHLYMYDRKSGHPMYQITKGEWYVRDVIEVDETNGKIYFTANGVNKDVDPYFIGYYVINMDGSDLVELTPGDGTHKALFSRDKKYLIDVYSSINKAPVTVLRDASTGEQLMEIAKGDVSKLEANGWKAPEVFVAPGRDGKTPMWGLIYRPINFDPSKKYPVIEYIYQGPGDQYVPKSFTPYYWWATSLAELGFIVVQVDGMGTSFRSREFENICYKNLADAGIPDHMAWIKEAGRKYPYMDLDRVGIYGCSAGGQESLGALLQYPDFYKACYSACGCHDNRMDKIWWNELWLGYPINDSYLKASNVENAHKLQHPLMLVVGELDDNVDPASTMQVADALIKSNKDFELVVIPGAHHTMGEDFGEHKRYDFFIKNLYGLTPPKWSEIDYK